MTALTGFRLLQLRETPPVALAAFLLAEMGMDVIHVAQPEALGGRPRGSTEDAAYDVLGRNKRSIRLDLRSKQGHRAFDQLARSAAVILESNRPGATKRLRIDYATVASVAPTIVYCSISGHGQTGPLSDLLTYDPEACAAAGVTATNVDEDGNLVPFGALFGDVTAGLHAALAIQTALLHRERTGRGQYIDVSMTASMMTHQLIYAAQFLRTGQVQRENLALASLFRCRDERYISSTNPTPPKWAAFCQAVGLPQLSDRPSNPGWRDPDWRAEVLRPIRDRFLSKGREDWFDTLRQAGCPVARVLDMDEVFLEPQTLERGMLLELEHPTLGTVRHPGFPLSFSETPATFRRFASRLGDDTEDVLSELGYSPDEIADIKTAS